MSKKIIKEFDLINKYMKPLASGYSGALNLQDDVAILPKDSNSDYIITLDTIIEDTHFLSSASPSQIARKLMATNLSDVASCGGIPKYYFLTGNITPEMDDLWYKEFTRELKKIQKKYEIHLAGGDTVKAKNLNKKVFSVTMVAEVAKGKAILRKNAKLNDDIYVSGTLGLAWLGLQSLQGKMFFPAAKIKKYVKEYYSPTPQIDLGQKIIGLANSCADISDGLIKDLKNIANASQKSAEIYANNIPVDSRDENIFLPQITAGDDYQLVFTASKHHRKKIEALNCIRIGKIIATNAKSEVILLDENRKIIKVKKTGYEH